MYGRGLALVRVMNKKTKFDAGRKSVRQELSFIFQLIPVKTYLSLPFYQSQECLEYGVHGVRLVLLPPSSEYGTYKTVKARFWLTVKARFWLWLSGKIS